MDTGASVSNLSQHKFFRLMWNDIVNHPHKATLAFLHGTVLVRGGKVLSIGYNSPFRCGFSDKYATHKDFNIHSELAAVRAVRKKIDLTGAAAYNLRLDRSGNPKISAPCRGCATMFLDYGIRKCYYSTDTGLVDVLKISSDRVSDTGLFSAGYLSHKDRYSFLHAGLAA